MYYDKRFKKKPEGWENSEVQKNLKQTEIEIKELAEALSNGATFKPAFLNGTKSIDWISQQLFALDFDHDTSINIELKRCRELNILPCFGYTSFSHSEQEHHFRLVFCNNTVITNIDKRKKLQLTLISLFNNSDIKTKDPTRLFYGGKKLICSDYENRINADEIIEKYYIESKKPILPVLHKTKSNNRKYKKTATMESNHLLKIEAIKNRNVQIMQSLLKGDTNKEDIYSSSISINIQLKSEKELYDFINSIDLHEYLGIYGTVKCILPEHDDHTPSAHIYITDDGTQVYKCFGCDKSYTITSITEKLAGCRRSEAIEFIKKVYNIKLVQSDWTLKQKQLMIDSANYLDSDDFKITYPELSKLIRTRKHHIKEILLYLSQYVNDDMKVNGKPFFFASYKTLMNVCGIKGNRNTLSQSLTLFALVNMIIKLPVEEIPEKELKKAKAIATKYHHKKLTGFYSFEEYGTLLFEECEEIAKTLKKNNITLKGLSREYILRTFGTSLADKVYPQFKYENKQGNSNKSDKHTLEISECLFYLLDKKGYATEKEIIYMLGKRYVYQSTAIQIKKSLTEILLSYDLVRVKASKKNKLKYGINDDKLSYQAYVICHEIN